RFSSPNRSAAICHGEYVGGQATCHSSARSIERFWAITTRMRWTARRKPYTTQKKLNATREKSTRRIGRQRAKNALTMRVANIRRRQNSFAGSRALGFNAREYRSSRF